MRVLALRSRGQENRAMSQSEEAASARGLDRRSVRRRFDRRAESYEDASRLEQEIGVRMLERLDYLRVSPRRILDAGAGTSREAQALRKRYPDSRVFAVDHSLGLLRAARSGRGLIRRLSGDAPPASVCADLERLPFPNAVFDFVWSNMAIHWLDEPLPALKELARVVSPDAPLLVSALGPDSLVELRRVAGSGRVHSFMDMHDLGDRIVGAGFTAPVVDSERLTVTYPDVEALLRELRNTGQTSSLANRLRGLSGRGLLSRLRGMGLDSDGRVAVTFEIVYALAWRAAPRRQDDRAVIRFEGKSGARSDPSRRNTP